MNQKIVKERLQSSIITDPSKISLSLVTVSAIVLFVGMTMTEGCSSTAGALEQALSQEAQQRCSNGSLMFNGGIVGLIIGAAGLLYANAQE